MDKGIVGIGDFQLLIQDFNKLIGQEFTILDTKKKKIVGKVKIIQPPEKLVIMETYKVKVYKRKGKK